MGSQRSRRPCRRCMVALYQRGSQRWRQSLAGSQVSMRVHCRSRVHTLRRGEKDMPAITTMAHGLRFPEGPVAMPDGSVVLVEIERQTLSRVRPNGEVSVIVTLGGGPNGA